MQPAPTGRAARARRRSAALDENYKLVCLQDVRPVSDSNPLIGDPSLFVDDPVEFRLFCCPGCGTLIENEIAVATDPILRDMFIALPVTHDG